jgi:hypothetical protein
MTADAFHRVYEYGRILQPGESVCRANGHAWALFTVAAIHGNGMPLIEKDNGHMGMPVVLPLAGHLAGAAVNTSVKVHIYDLHGVSL